MEHKPKVILLILDGWGKGKPYEGNAIHLANTPFIDQLGSNYPTSELLTHGEHVGLPAGQMGNSEVGHINIGAGRVVDQELQRINKALGMRTIHNNPTFQQLISTAKSNNNTIHLIGLISDGGVHSHINHFFELIDILNEEQISTNIHAFTDGRDTDPHGGLDYLKELSIYGESRKADIVSVIGRYYAMDRDRRWERTALAYNLLTHGEGAKFEDVLEGVQQSYKNNITDEFIKPIVKVNEDGEPIGTIQEGDVVLFVNFRTDRPRQLTDALTQNTFPDFGMKPIPLSFYTMTKYDERLTNLQVIFEKENVRNTLGEVLSDAGKQQIRIAETEKYPHVTFFFNGGREVEFAGESRILVNSPKVATYDLQPEMSANEITAKIIPEIQTGDVDFICLNFANADMVGHTGIVEASIIACETVDRCVEQIVTAGLENNYQFLITADHGNSDYMINEDGSPNTAHTTNPVPLYYVANDIDTVSLKNGILADLAPTILRLMQIEKPKEMSGDNLIKS